MQRSGVLVVAAFEPELRPFRPALGAELSGTVSGVTVTARPVGIGLVAAGVGAAALLSGHRPRAIVLVGTCGAYDAPEPTAPSIGEAVVARIVRLVDPGAVARLSEFPPSLRTYLHVDERLRAGLAGQTLRCVDVATTLAITVDDRTAASVARTGHDVEHLEAFSVGSASAAAGVAFAAVLGVANAVGSKGREQWRTNHLRAADAAAQCVLRWLREGAVGLPPVAD